MGRCIVRIRAPPRDPQVDKNKTICLSIEKIIEKKIKFKILKFKMQTKIYTHRDIKYHILMQIG